MNRTACTRDCNAHQGRGRCSTCPDGAAQVLAGLPRIRTLLLLMGLLLVLYGLTGCGGGDPEDLEADGIKTSQPPQCELHPDHCR